MASLYTDGLIYKTDRSHICSLYFASSALHVSKAAGRAIVKVKPETLNS